MQDRIARRAKVERLLLALLISLQAMAVKEV